MKNEGLKNAIWNLDREESYKLKESYYDVACNIQPTIEALELALFTENNKEITNKKQAGSQLITQIAIEKELKLYRAMQTLLNRSELGAIL